MEAAGSNPNCERLAELTKILVALAADTDTNESRTVQACNLTSQILALLPECKDFKDPSLLEAFAKLAASSPENLHIQQNFVHLVLLHLFSPSLFTVMRGILATKEASPKEPCYDVPDWWPESKENVDVQNLASPYDSSLDIAAFSKYDIAEIHSLAYNLVEILPCVDTIVRESQPAWGPFNAIIAIMSKSRAHRDLVALVMCHDEKMINALHRSATSPHSVSGQQYAKFCLESVLSRPAILHISSAIHGLPGAKSLINLYTHHSHGAYEVAAKKPFRYVLDLLNHASSTVHARNTTLVTCIYIASTRLASINVNRDARAVYEEFNELSSVSSLLSVTTHFGRLAAQFLLENHGDSTGTSKFFKSLNAFHHSSLPPLARPNYFFSEPKPSPANETLATSMRLDEFDELHRSLFHILKFLSAIIGHEVTSALSMMSSGMLAEKIYIRSMQPFYFFIMLVLRCNEKLNENSFIAQTTLSLVVDVIGALLKSYDSVLAWTTLFNFATKVSYNEVGTVRIWRKLFTELRSKETNDRFQELINTRINQFCAVFCPDASEKGQLLSPQEPVGQVRVGAIARDEYMRLYQNLVGAKGDVEDGPAKMASHYSVGRQQSVHVDKFGKERM